VFHLSPPSKTCDCARFRGWWLCSITTTNHCPRKRVRLLVIEFHAPQQAYMGPRRIDGWWQGQLRMGISVRPAFVFYLHWFLIDFHPGTLFSHLFHSFSRTVVLLHLPLPSKRAYVGPRHGEGHPPFVFYFLISVDKNSQIYNMCINSNIPEAILLYNNINVISMWSQAHLTCIQTARLWWELGSGQIPARQEGISGCLHFRACALQYIDTEGLVDTEIA
jgi:hypothetical protein